MKAMIRNAAVLALVLAATTASAGRRCPKGYILNDDDVCVPVNPPPPSCTYPASDGSCLTVTKDATGHISKITGTGKDGIWRTVEYTQHNYVGQPEGLMTGCNPPDAQHDGPWGCIGFSDLDSNWVSMTYTDGRNNW